MSDASGYCVREGAKIARAAAGTSEEASTVVQEENDSGQDWAGDGQTDSIAAWELDEELERGKERCAQNGL